MAFDPGGLRASSPASTGRVSPVQRFRTQTSEDGAGTKDKNYRRYALAVERALSSFDTAQQEWADYISFLNRLLKALQANPPNNHAIPQAHLIATRLAQCLKPSLPSGVHQKALEVYSFVFTIIGQTNLSRDFHIYFPGLASVLSFASLSVRPLFLSLFTDHILRVDERALRPALKSVILCLLPGLEDETSEDFDRVLEVLNTLREASPGDSQHPDKSEGSEESTASVSFFWQCFFLATITNPSRRQGALTYLTRHLPRFSTKRSSSQEQALKSLSYHAQAALSPEPGLLIRSFASGLTDQHVLIQRGFLDLLVSHLPLHSAVLQHAVPSSDLDRLVLAAVGVVSRRDMSLNRRLWSWFLGPEPQTDDEKAELPSESKIASPTVDLSQHHAAYFARYGLRALTRSVLALLEKDTMAAAERARPFRICLSLMDRWEVGGLLIPHIFIPALINVFKYQESASKRDAEEVLKSASNFFDGVESGLIWAKVVELANDALGSGSKSPSERLFSIRLCAFIMQRFNLREEEMIIYHMPLTALFILMSTGAQEDSQVNIEIQTSALDILEKLISVIPQRAFTSTTETEGKRDRNSSSIFAKIKKFYDEDQGMIENDSPPLPPQEIGEQLLRHSIVLFVRTIRDELNNPALIDLSARVLCGLLRIIPDPDRIIVKCQTLETLHEALRADCKLSMQFPKLQAVAAALGSILTATSGTSLTTSKELMSFYDLLVRQIWDHLDPLTPKYHVEAVRSLWQLESVPGTSRRIEATITNLLTTKLHQQKNRCEMGRKFAVFWAHSMQEKSVPADKGQRNVPRRTSSYAGIGGTFMIPSDTSVILSRPLLVMLDWLEDVGSDEAAFVTSWLQQLPSLPKVFDILTSHIRDLKCMNQAPASEPKTQARTKFQVRDREEGEFYLRHIYRIIHAASEHTWIVVASEMVQPFTPSSMGDESEVSLHELLIQICMHILATADYNSRAQMRTDLERIALDTIQVIIEGPFSAPLKELELENKLLAMVNSNLPVLPPQLQTSFLSTINSCLKLRQRNVTASLPKSPHQNKLSRDNHTYSQNLLPKESDSKETFPAQQLPPPGLVECIKLGFSSTESRLILDEWVSFLRNVLPLLSDTLFQNLIPLVEVFCSQISDCFEGLRSAFVEPDVAHAPPEPTIISLLNGLEQLLATAHDKLISDESRIPMTKSPEQPQGFFGNVSNMTGLFSGEIDKQPTRAATANNRLAVLLCFQDTLRSCFQIWTWGVHGHQNLSPATLSAASFSYTSLRLRKRALKVLENLFAAEALECLEMLAKLFCNPISDDCKPSYVLELLNVLNGSRPKYTAPAIFNAIYRRINDDDTRENIKTSNLTATDLVGFLVEYIKSIEDDAMDEIWSDCMAFLKDILNNPLDYSQILPLLLNFVALIAEKVDNTNFGEQRKMRKELGDTFLKLLTATFTALGPAGFLQDSGSVPITKGRSSSNGSTAISKQQDFALTLASVVSKLPIILNDNERISIATNIVSSNVIAPALRAKAFPRNIDQSFLELLLQLTKISQGAKAWRKDVLDALNDPKFFAIPADLSQNYILPILRQLVVNDKERMPELLGRLTAPTTAGIVFGVGASSARIEADRKTQLNLRRIAALILAGDEDAFVERYRTIEEKLTDLLTATPTSSPSSNTRAEIFMVIRALIMRSSSVYLSPFWPLINTEIQNAILSMLPESSDTEQYNNASVLQACKVLDLLVALDLDDFQLHEWLFITDTIDAVYRPSNFASAALADEVAEALGSTSLENRTTWRQESTSSGKRCSFLEPLLSGLEDVEASELKLLPRRDLATRILQPFFGQLSIMSFEATYEMTKPDMEAFENSLLLDLFEETEA
ncbi:uncharacterized protein PV09_05939 [Verruconis gallopava]|uniref:Uncharacterized protein n=1 Tax=Verruconis gallopava TaxID=253628 RepID=A0A0D2AUQ8_9PEZI|nr:uncharacterized protein PV09_05939 [Verruconis gallopava]KIW02889.1 hypothetical protein PV09_05939 [Verruconis gallopava]